MRAQKSSHQCSGCTYLRYNKPSDSECWCGHPGAPKGEVVRSEDHCDDWEAWQVPENEKLTLPWEYCECGCKSSELRIGGVYFHLHWDLKDGWYLSDSHGINGNRKRYGSAPEAEAVVKKALRDALDKQDEQQTAIKAVLDAAGPKEV